MGARRRAVGPGACNRRQIAVPLTIKKELSATFDANALAQYGLSLDRRGNFPQF